jgi:hypothetical protein
MIFARDQYLASNFEQRCDFVESALVSSGAGVIKLVLIKTPSK